MAPNLMYHIGQLSALQGLDVHGFEGSASAYASHLHSPFLLSLSCCIHLHWLDISHWAVKEPEVRQDKGLTAFGLCRALLCCPEQVVWSGSGVYMIACPLALQLQDRIPQCLGYGNPWWCQCTEDPDFCKDAFARISVRHENLVVCTDLLFKGFLMLRQSRDPDVM